MIAARDWLAQAFRLGDAKEIKLQALEDPDLAPLWESQGAVGYAIWPDRLREATSFSLRVG